MSKVGNAVRSLLAAGGVIACLPATAEAAEGASAGLTEVVVSAQRTQESLQDVPVSVTALSAEDLARRQVTNTLDVISQVPNLVGSTNVGLGSATAFFLRGVGQDESLSTSDPAVGTYVDGVYVARQINNNAFLYDVERIEVLRGPQGTLYGRNTSGGAVKIITKKPERETSGYVDLAYGDYERTEAKAMFNAPLSDSLAVRLNAFWMDQGEGFIKNLTTGEEDWAPEGVGARAQVRWQPSDAVDFTLAVEWADEEGTGFIGSDANRNTDRDFFTVVSGLRDQFAETDQVAVTLNGTFTLGGVSVESVTGWRDLNQRFLLDLSDDPVPQYVLPHDSNHKQLSQEFTFSGEVGALDWVGGVFYMQEENRSEIGDELFLFGGVVAANFRRRLLNDTDSWGVFAQGTWNFTDRLAATVGGRYTEEKKDVDITQFFVAPPLGARQPGGSGYPGRTGTLVPLWNTTAIRANGTPSDVTFSEFTPKFGLEFAQTDSLLWFASYTEGFKSGGWNARVTDPADFVLFRPETVKSYEVGVKSQWVDDRLRANVTVFRADYDDFIITALNQQGRFVTVNAAEARIEGLEAEVLFRATPQLDLFANLGTMDGEYLSLVGADFPLSNEIKRTPDLSWQIGFDLDIPAPALGGEFFSTATYSHQDEYYNGLRNAPVELAPATDLLDFTLGYAPEDGRWQVAASCKNCTDEQYFHSTLNFGQLGFATQFPGLPRTWRLSFRYNFGAL
ncbi:MAG: TonB-dependent receptor [Steroidobacteraceae bacterium]|jgi:iron complex outermembrane receptor protein|nr:TonB-dependent receptor [Steroidobacteraceae bacterium]